jgi:hypothetical protein
MQLAYAGALVLEIDQDGPGHDRIE